ncbi:phosphate-starvation-inducible PsiE family protein [Pleurocapsales cyanobacterium LEGE 06147]|nr:phosphate-starvation-inducible PsiE family protein [Pleurocapsales cyanobacterium LEGE 06147]
MARGKNLIKHILTTGKNENFLKLVHWIENLVAKVLSIVLLVLILVALADLVFVITRNILAEPIGFINKTLIELFGLFLNILIALELLENITAYLKKHIFQVELVIATSLIAVARKIIIFDLQKYSGTDLIGLALAILALSISYWLIRRVRSN